MSNTGIPVSSIIGGGRLVVLLVVVVLGLTLVVVELESDGLGVVIFSVVVFILETVDNVTL